MRRAGLSARSGRKVCARRRSCETQVRVQELQDSEIQVDFVTALGLALKLMPAPIAWPWAGETLARPWRVQRPARDASPSSPPLRDPEP